MNKLEKKTLNYILKSNIRNETKEYFLSKFIQKEVIELVKKYEEKIFNYEENFYHYLNPFRKKP